MTLLATFAKPPGAGCQGVLEDSDCFCFFKMMIKFNQRFGEIM